MEQAYENEFHAWRMNAEQAREEVYRQQARPFYLIRPRVFLDGNMWCCLYGEDLQTGVSAFGITPEDASRVFDEVWETGQQKDIKSLAAKGGQPK